MNSRKPSLYQATIFESTTFKHERSLWSTAQKTFQVTVSFCGINQHVITYYVVKRLGWKIKRVSIIVKEKLVCGYNPFPWIKLIQDTPVDVGAGSALPDDFEDRFSAEHRITSFIEPRIVSIL